MPTALTDIPSIAGGAHKTVPIIEDGGKTVAGILLWIASIGTAPLLKTDDPLLEWLGQDLHGGLGRKSPLNALAA